MYLLEYCSQLNLIVSLQKPSIPYRKYIDSKSCTPSRFPLAATYRMPTLKSGCVKRSMKYRRLRPPTPHLLTYGSKSRRRFYMRFSWSSFLDGYALEVGHNAVQRVHACILHLLRQRGPLVEFLFDAVVKQ